MRSYLLWCAGTLAFPMLILRLQGGAWPDSVELIAMVLASPLVGGALWLR